MPERSPQIDPQLAGSTSKSPSKSQLVTPLPIAWMRRRLRTTMWLAGVLIGVQTLSALPSGNRSPAATSASNAIQPSSISRMSKPRSVAPTGWRRTADGWQHVSTWVGAAAKIPLSQRIVAQRNAQPVWMRLAMDSIRQIPPGAFAFAQLVSVGLLFWIVNRKKISVVDQTCPATSQ